MARKKIYKQLLNARALHGILSLLASLCIRFIYLTNRAEKHFPDETLPYFRGELPAIFCFWHGRMIFQPFLNPRGKKMFVLISNHNDGALITAAMRWFGVGSVRGSRKKGGAHALRELFKVTEAHDNIAITPDGPRGPFQRAAEGAAFVAAKTGYPLIPISFSATRHRRFDRSWDRFMMPLPFGRVAFVAGQPLHVAAQSDDAAITVTTRTLGEELTRITTQADALCGVSA